MAHGVALEQGKPTATCHCFPQLPLPSAALTELFSSVGAEVWVAGASSLPLSLLPQKKSKVHYHIAVIINYLGHCISLVALLVAFVLFLRLR